MIQQIEQPYDEVENYRLPMQAKMFHTTQGIFYCAVITQSAKWFVGLIDLEQHTAVTDSN